MVFIVISVGVRGPGVEESLKGDPSERWSFVRPGVFEAIGVISFAFVVRSLCLAWLSPADALPKCHHNSLLIYGSLRTPTLDRFAQVTHVSTTLSVIACLCMSTSGFLVFTDKTQGNILNNFSTDDTLINIARACVSFLSLPMKVSLTSLRRSLAQICSARFLWKPSCAEKLWRRISGLERTSTSGGTSSSLRA